MMSQFTEEKVEELCEAYNVSREEFGEFEYSAHRFIYSNLETGLNIADYIPHGHTVTNLQNLLTEQLLRHSFEVRDNKYSVEQALNDVIYRIFCLADVPCDMKDELGTVVVRAFLVGMSKNY